MTAGRAKVRTFDRQLLVKMSRAQREHVERVARAEGCTLAAVIRRLIDVDIAREAGPDRLPAHTQARRCG